MSVLLSTASRRIQAQLASASSSSHSCHPPTGDDDRAANFPGGGRPSNLFDREPLPWFLRGRLEGGANLVEVIWATPLAETGGGACSYLSTDVPEADFFSMLQRASQHEGYRGTQRDFREFRVRDVRMRVGVGGGGVGASIACEPVHCDRRSVCEVRPVAGTPLIVRTFRHDPVAFSAFPCDVPLDDRRRVRRLELRVHRSARLIFESCRSDRSEAPASVRSVRLEINVGGGGGAHAASDIGDLRRTTENTIQNVLLRMKPRYFFSGGGRPPPEKK